MKPVYLDICNIPNRIEMSSDMGFYRLVKQRYKNFLRSPKNTMLNLSINITRSLKTIPRINKPAVSAVKNGYSVKGPGFLCTLFRKADKFLGSSTCRESIYAFDSLLRVLWTQILLMQNGFLVHACGISNNAGGYLFPGPSGSGKTTLARKSPPRAVLSDELVGLNVSNNRNLIMGTPFWGEFQQGGLALTRPLQGIYFLKPHHKLRLSQISIATALRKMLRLVLFFNNDPASGKKLFQIMTRCVHNTPCYNLYLPKKIPYRTIINALDKAK